MQLILNIGKTHLMFFLIAIAVVMGIGLAVATVPTPVGHGADQVGSGTFSGTSGDSWTFPGDVCLEGEGTDCRNSWPTVNSSDSGCYETTSTGWGYTMTQCGPGYSMVGFLCVSRYDSGCQYYTIRCCPVR